MTTRGRCGPSYIVSLCYLVSLGRLSFSTGLTMEPGEDCPGGRELPQKSNYRKEASPGRTLILAQAEQVGLGTSPWGSSAYPNLNSENIYFSDGKPENYPGFCRVGPMKSSCESPRSAQGAVHKAASSGWMPARGTLLPEAVVSFGDSFPLLPPQRGRRPGLRGGEKI